MKSLDAYRAYIRFTMPAVSDSSRLEAYIRDLVVVQPDKTVRQAMSDSVAQAKPRLVTFPVGLSMRVPSHVTVS